MKHYRLILAGFILFSAFCVVMMVLTIDFNKTEESDQDDRVKAEELAATDGISANGDWICFNVERLGFDPKEQIALVGYGLSGISSWDYDPARSLDMKGNIGCYQLDSLQEGLFRGTIRSKHQWANMLHVESAEKFIQPDEQNNYSLCLESTKNGLAPAKPGACDL